MNKGVKWTIVFIILVTVGVLGTDAGIAMKWGGDATISTVITTYSHKILAIPFAFGLLMGHFFLGDST